jgi:phosphoenolpyruvate synthase/pyruvate phosphate dikinase
MNVWAFELPQMQPNFITSGCASGEVAFVQQSSQDISGKILFIPSADPGYDWIFSHDISGFVTMYGGLNSHMAIRAGELGMPAVIGAGEALFMEWSKAKALEIDCLNRQVKIIR